MVKPSRKGLQMEIFRAASAQMQNTLSVENAYQADTRAIERTGVEQKAAESNEQFPKELSESAQKQLEEAMEQLNENMRSLDTNIRFGFSDKIGGMYINVVRADNGDLIRKIPSEQAMRLTENFREIIGALFDKKE